MKNVLWYLAIMGIGAAAVIGTGLVVYGIAQGVNDVLGKKKRTLPDIRN